jgi:hypothetical protein
MDTDERIAVLEQRLAAYDTLVGKLIAYARTTTKGKIMLAMLGLKP